MAFNPIYAIRNRHGQGTLLPYKQGSTSAAGAMLRSLQNGGYVDVMVIGDSNSGFDGTTTSRGYSGGIWETLQDASGWNRKEYGTGLGECAANSASSLYPLNGANGENNTSQFYVSVNGTTGSSTWSRGSALVSAADFIYYPGTAGYSLYYPFSAPNYNTKDWSYLANPTSAGNYLSDWVALNKNASYPNALDCDQASFFRITGIKFPNQSTARIQTWMYMTSGPTTVASQRTEDLSNATSDYAIYSVERDISAATRTKMYGVYAASSSVCKGPVGVLFRSFYRKNVPGFSVTNFQTYAGGTSEQIGLSMSDSVGCKYTTIKTYLRELVTRQQAAGGLGNVLVFCNMGTNDGTTNSATNYPVAANTIVSQFNKAWNELGYPPNQLAFILTASAAWTSYNPDQTISNLRAAYSDNPQVSVFNINAVAPQSYLVANSYYAGNSATPQAHLSATGYKTVSKMILDGVASA